MRRKPLQSVDKFDRKAALADEPELAPIRSKKKSKRLKLHGDWAVASGVMVSDHAVIRYLEIHYGLDADAIRREMVANGRGDIIKDLRTCKVPIGTEGAKMIVRDGLIVTVLKGSYAISEKAYANRNGNGTR